MCWHPSVGDSSPTLLASNAEVATNGSIGPPYPAGRRSPVGKVSAGGFPAPARPPAGRCQRGPEIRRPFPNITGGAPVAREASFPALSNGLWLFAEGILCGNASQIRRLLATRSGSRCQAHGERYAARRKLDGACARAWSDRWRLARYCTRYLLAKPSMTIRLLPTASTIEYSSVR